MTPSAPALLALAPESQRSPLREATEGLGVDLRLVDSLSELFEALGERSWTATFLSFSAPGADEGVAHRVSGEGAAGALLLSAPGASLESALISERAGAVQLLREPLDPAAVRGELEGLLAVGKAVPLPERDGENGVGPAIVGSGPALAEVFRTVARVAATPATVLLTGESGTGKELVAQAVHEASDRCDGPFVPVNCAAIPEQLLESELFGHERGAFTGAVARKKGRFERADGGTLFLDEIGEMSLVLQAKILRALEERRVERVGGEGAIELDVRIVAATNRSLATRIEEGEFREDLYYRLAVVELHLPPLRERDGDLRELALHFAAHFARLYGRPLRGITEGALERLEAHHWPGNVRELRNVMDRAVALARTSILRPQDLRLGERSPRLSPRGGEGEDGSGYPPIFSLEEVEARHIERVLRHTEGRIVDAAEILGIHRNTLSRKVREYGIDLDD